MPQCKVPNPETMKSGAENQKVPGEEAAVKTSGAMKKRHRKRNITAECSGQPEKQTWGNCGVRKELIVAGSKMTHRAGVARHEGNFIRKYWTRNSVEQETQKGWTFRKRRLKGLECNNGIRCRDVKKPLHPRTRRKTAKSIGGRNRREQPWLEGMGNSNEIFWKTCGLGFMKQAVGIPSGLWQIRNWRV
jgi:hypothetical protein